jgi:hypothetical protein
MGIGERLRATKAVLMRSSKGTIASLSCDANANLLVLVGESVIQGGISRAGANQPIHWFLGGKGLDIQQGTSIWVGSPKSISSFSRDKSEKPSMASDLVKLNEFVLFSFIVTFPHQCAQENVCSCASL